MSVLNMNGVSMTKGLSWLAGAMDPWRQAIGHRQEAVGFLKEYVSGVICDGFGSRGAV